MKKVLLFFVMVFAAVTAFAETKEVTFDATVNMGVNDYDEGTGNYTAADQSITLGGVTIASPACIWYNVEPTKNQYRIYKGKNLTITSTVGSIVKVEFTCEYIDKTGKNVAIGAAKYGPGCFTTEIGNYTYEEEGTHGTWVGEADEVVFTAPDNQVRATKIVVTVELPDDPFANTKIASITQSDFVEAGKWYLLKQKRGPQNDVLVTPVHDEGIGKTMKRAAADEVVSVGTFSSDAVSYLLKFIPTENDGAYNIQFANGNYWASTMTTTADEPGEYNVYNINGEAGHIGINKYKMDNIVDNNGAGKTLAFWGTGEVTSLNGNNDWTVWEVEFENLTENELAVKQFKAFVEEAEAEYQKNNEVRQLGEGIITSTDQFSSEYTDEEEGSLENLLDGDGSTFWHSTWHHGDDTPMHVHYLQVEFAEPISGDFELNMNRRVNGESLCGNDNPIKMSVEISMDGVEFELADEFDTPLTQTAAAPLVQAVFNIPTAAKYLRFFADECNGGSNRGYWHCGDLQLKPVIVPSINSCIAEEAAALGEAIENAKALGNNATIEDVQAFNEVYNAYLDKVDVVTDINTIAAPVVASKNVYDLTGRRVVAPVKGQLYIQNGKKMIF